MKKRLKAGSAPIPPQVEPQKELLDDPQDETQDESQDEPNVAEILGKIQQHLVYLEKKLDTLIAQSSARPFERKEPFKPYHRPDASHRPGEFRQGNDTRDRVLHKVICADCKQECEVPFKPFGGRPVYCKQCFGARRPDGPAKETHGHRHPEGEHRQSVVFYKGTGRPGTHRPARPAARDFSKKGRTGKPAGKFSGPRFKGKR